MTREIDQSPLFLALDQGGHASRAMVFNQYGETLAESSQPIHTKRYDDCVELDAHKVTESLLKAIMLVAQQLGEQSHRITSAALATQRSNMLCWRRSSGQALSPILSWQDRRAESRLVGMDKKIIHQKTGLFSNAHYGASKMAWCLENIESVKQAALEDDLYIGPMASYLASCLTGSPPLADPSNASRTLLWNIEKRDWDDELCQWFGIERENLPRCVNSNHGFGMMKLGNTHTIPLALVTGDLAAAAFANGWPKQNLAYITLGTGAFVQRINSQRFSHPRLLSGMLMVMEDKQYISMEGTVNGAGSAIDWLASEQNIDAEQIINHLPEWLQQNQKQNPPAFINAVSGLGSPVWCAHAQSSFEFDSNLAANAISLVESIVFLLALNIQTMEECLPPPVEIVISGGLAQIDEICQRLADITSKPVRRYPETEATAKGLAFLLSINKSRWKTSPSVVFDAISNTGLEQRFTHWLEFMRQELTGSCLYFD